MKPRENAAGPMVKPGGRELELKFLVSEPAFRASQSWPALPPAPPRRAARLRSFYYDTASGALRQHHMALRMRRHRRGYLLTLKYDGGFDGGAFERGEAEVFTQSEVPEPALLGQNFADAIAAATGGERLGLAFETDFRRVTSRLTSATSDIELAFDSGHIIAGGAKIRIREIEMELKSGEPSDLYRLGIELAQNFPVRLGTLAKSDRGFLLLTGTAPRVCRAGPPLAGAPSIDEAMFTLLTGCLSHFTGNFGAFEDGDSAGAIHQMRVALRRLRGLLGLFYGSFPCPAFLTFREQAKNLASAMNEARNLDVFMELVARGPQRMFQGDQGLRSIMAECAARRLAEYEKIKTLLAAPGTTTFILSLQSSLSRKIWRNAVSADVLAQLTGPAESFAAQQIVRMHRRILKQGGKRLNVAADERHELRIRVKKLRYAAESFSGIFGEKKSIRAYHKSAAALQEALGRFNDLITARQIVATLPQENTREAGIILGFCARGAANDEEVIEAWRAFRQMKNPFG